MEGGGDIQRIITPCTLSKWRSLCWQTLSTQSFKKLDPCLNTSANCVHRFMISFMYVRTMYTMYIVFEVLCCNWHKNFHICHFKDTKQSEKYLFCENLRAERGICCLNFIKLWRQFQNSSLSSHIFLGHPVV